MFIRLRLSGSKCVHVLYLFPLIQGKMYMYDSKTGSDNVAMVHCGSKHVHVLCIFPLITGKMYDSKTGSDYCTYSGTMPDSACRYRVDSSSESGYGSLMYKQFLNQVRWSSDLRISLYYIDIHLYNFYFQLFHFSCVKQLNMLFRRKCVLCDLKISLRRMSDLINTTQRINVFSFLRYPCVWYIVYKETCISVLFRYR